MKFLFIDNFRGFQNTFIPITDVNFLVGENSTGKTSVLSLMKLLSQPSFLFSQEFRDQHINFGHFSDMVSAHSDDQSYFRIGFIWEETAKKKREPFSIGWLATYVKHEGLPRLEKYTFCRQDQIVSLKIKESVFFRATKCRAMTSAMKMASMFPRWLKEHAASGTEGYEKLVTPPGFPKRLPLFVAMAMILNPSPSPKKGDLSLTFYNPREGPFWPDLTWVAPIRTKPKRTYDELTLEFSPEGTHTPYLIRRMLKSKKAAINFRRFIEKVGRGSGLFESVKIRSFGQGATAPFEVDIVLDGKAFNLNTVGYGVSQSLPVFVEALARSRGTWFAIQQPEIHLHPRAQAALGDTFYEMAVREDKCFLVETHSDFMIDRFRMNYRKGKGLKKPKGQILFFERRNRRNTVVPISISESGEPAAQQPEGYRKFFIKEELRLIGI